MDLDELRRRCAAGERFRYLHFWGHKEKHAITSACLSQWYPAAFDVGGVRYATAEHWMMASKARLFGDDAALARILADPDPRAAKAQGRIVVAFDSQKWDAERRRIVVEGNVAKFSQHRELRAFLTATGDRVLVEASPTDRIWGIGMPASDPRASDPAAWLGLNLLGFALMDARAELRGRSGRPLTLEEVAAACKRRGMKWPARSADALFTYDVVSPAIEARSEALWTAFHAHWQARGLDFFREHYGAPLGFVIERANAVLETLGDP